MGYIFDALNRSDDEQRRDPAATPGDPTPPPPALDQDDALDPIENDFASPHETDRLDEADPADEPRETGEPAVAHDETAEPEAPRPLTLAQPPERAYARHESRVAPASPPAPARSAADTPNVALGDVDQRLVVITEPGSIIAEQYRSIRTALLARWQNKRHLLHTITSATPQEGKTITSLNLGLSFAELRNRRTLVLECDLRLPTIAKLLNVDPGAGHGITDYLRGDADYADVFRTVGDTGLTVACAGSRADTDAVQLLHSQTTAELLDKVRAEFDHVIIDTPPVVELADAGILGAQSDEVLLVSRMNRTPKAMIEQAISTLQSYHAPVAGMIATDQQRTRRRSYQYRYGYRYRYGYHYGKPEGKPGRKAA
ncbi:MAG: CpsD/CapB family tyrosine-protein kinase [Planctomycetota bacterium]